jgi:hypothetical protein
MQALATELRYAGHTLKGVFRENSIAIYARAHALVFESTSPVLELR